MQRILIILVCFLAMVASVARASTFPLKDGTSITGKADSIANKGVIFQLDSGEYSPLIPWDNLTEPAVRTLLQEAKSDKDRELLEPMVESFASEVAKRKEIVIKPIQTPDRPRQGSGLFGLFGSPVGWMILIVLYCANLFAAYEVHVYRRQPLGLVLGLAAIPFFGVLSPIIFGMMPTQLPPPEPVQGAAPAEAADVTPEGAAVEGGDMAEGVAGTDSPAAPAAPAKPSYPDPIVFAKGEFSFNRRFFETKFAGFFRVVPSEAEKDLVLVITAARGKFVGRRIMRITPNDLALQVFKGEASSDEVIPFVEISEVQIRHKETV